MEIKIKPSRTPRKIEAFRVLGESLSSPHNIITKAEQAVEYAHNSMLMKIMSNSSAKTEKSRTKSTTVKSKSKNAGNKKYLRILDKLPKEIRNKIDSSKENLNDM